mmetsp:Transcript_852/g.1863  ORF Transcript_852/g.1863 Transcript_852/m.1863 type:complete len:282 (+) Transcript_852:795-1640(+)
MLRLSHGPPRGSLRRGGLCVARCPHKQGRGPHRNCRRRLVLHQLQQGGKGPGVEGHECNAPQGEPNRIGDGEPGCLVPVQAERLGCLRVPQVRGDGGLLHRRPLRWHRGGPHQVRSPLQIREAGQVQPAPQNRGGVGDPLRGNEVQDAVGLLNERPHAHTLSHRFRFHTRAFHFVFLQHIIIRHKEQNKGYMIRSNWSSRSLNFSFSFHVIALLRKSSTVLCPAGMSCLFLLKACTRFSNFNFIRWSCSHLRSSSPMANTVLIPSRMKMSHTLKRQSKGRV